MELEDVSGIGKATAERLRKAGIDTVEKLATIKIEDLIKLKIKGIGAATGKRYIQSALELFEGILPKNQIGLEAKQIEKPEEKSKKKQSSKKISELKKLIKQQAECNIGLVGHVDHGMTMSYRHFP